MLCEEFYRKPPNAVQMERMVGALRACYPRLKVFPIGKSVLGRTIYGLSIGNMRGSSLLVGGVHGLEWLTTLLLMRFCEDVLEAQSGGKPLAQMDVCRIFEGRGMILVPCLNPDGVEIAICGGAGALWKEKAVTCICQGDFSKWQANANGVDLNHNFDAGWEIVKRMELEKGINAPAPTRYGGECPFSEPESRAIANLCTNFGVRQAYAFHAQGEEIYYKYGPNTPARSQLMARVLASSCGYTVTVPEEMASHGGFKDWFIDKLYRPGFTIEIGRGKNPLPIEELEPIYARLLEMLILSVLI